MCVYPLQRLSTEPLDLHSSLVDRLGSSPLLFHPAVKDSRILLVPRWSKLWYFTVVISPISLHPTPLLCISSNFPSLFGQLVRTNNNHHLAFLFVRTYYTFGPLIGCAGVSLSRLPALPYLVDAPGLFLYHAYVYMYVCTKVCVYTWVGR